ncbi:hypothetical protein J437_LFUL016663 [Ladona fulva]|uniref:BRCT domain-containing protein n=1 Tax=Ladona fulva TaxID=123851 RepID=A0A8K0P4X8_LADFU|nr:hypothetical protein J437_LFUL016663 [Ladona fulva]
MDRFLEETKEEEESNEDDELKTRQSCPSPIPSEKEIKFEEDSISSTSLNISTCQTADAIQNGIKKENNKISQVPITFFFQASVLPSRGKAVVFTGFEFDESEMLSNVVYSLGGYQVDRAVTGRCTHVITNYPPKRTLNMLRGIARGCWIVSKEWVMKSLECNSWMDEEEFEIDYFLPAIKKARVSQQNGPPFPHRSVFSSCGPIYVGNDCSPPSSELKELISLCGGQLATCTRSAKVVVVGQGKIPASLTHRLANPQFVTEKWILDSISEESLRSFEHPYLVSVPNKRLTSVEPNS